jgi:hypothetical protein
MNQSRPIEQSAARDCFAAARQEKRRLVTTDHIERFPGEIRLDGRCSDTDETNRNEQKQLEFSL